MAGRRKKVEVLSDGVKLAKSRLSGVPWSEIRNLAEAGYPLVDLARAYGVSLWTLREYSVRHKWATPGRIRKAMKELEVGEKRDMAVVRAEMAEERRHEFEDVTFSGAMEALEEFFRRKPGVNGWRDAQIAAKMAGEAVGKSEDKGPAVNVGVQILNSQGRSMVRVSATKEPKTLPDSESGAEVDG